MSQPHDDKPHDDKPWLTDPKYGGMSPESAKRSYQAWLAQGGPNRKPTIVPKAEPWPAQSADQIELRKRQIEVQLDEYAAALKAYARFVGQMRAKRDR